MRSNGRTKQEERERWSANQERGEKRRGNWTKRRQEEKEEIERKRETGMER